VTQLPVIPAGASLRELLAEERLGTRPPDVRATSCTSDWRQVRPGDVYVAITGADDDGHDQAHLAAERGAAAVICERPLPVFHVPQCIVADSRATYGRLCQALVGNPSRQLKVIGVTGTHGKTTVARLLASIIREAGGRSGTLDSFGYWDGYEDSPPLVTLSPPALARSLAQMVAAGATHAIVEVSSRDLSQQTLAGVELDAACVTQVVRHRARWHGSLANYRRATRQIFDHLRPESVVVLNGDDPVSVQMLSELDQPALTYGVKGPSEITAEIVEQYVNEQTFVLSAGDDSVGVRTAVIGDHHVYNCLAAATLALAYGIEMTTIARGLEAVDSLPGRMERVMCGQDFAVLVDAADSAEALRVCLRAARNTTTGRVLCVFGASDEIDRAELPAIGRVIGAMSDVAVITTCSHLTDSHRSCLELRGGFADPRRAQIILDRGGAVRFALSQAQPGDTVVIAGMGERPHTPIDNQGGLANDCEIVRRALVELNHTPKQHRLAA
jgi:UDP-N-acetylmuramoyl-L-alanyl-D-glutamate--2,6-diaminopimelate ligase